MRSSIPVLCIALLGATASAGSGTAQTPSQLPPSARTRLAEARHLAAQVSGRIWPGWGHTPFQLLLVGDSAEFLLSALPEPQGFTRLGYDSLLQSQVWTRSRQFPPSLLATFPAVGGLPTIVVGSAERTGKSSTTWVLTLLHEHFHQWQYSQPDYYARVARLGLARGDTTGGWMLNYPFPYDSVPVQQAMRSLARSLAKAIATRSAPQRTALRAVENSRSTLLKILSADDYRYFEFQLWQEGVARFTEYAVARAARNRKPLPGFRSLPDYEPYREAADDALHHIQHELSQLDLAQDRRVAFYPIGAALALLLDQTRPDWKRAYARQPFTLPDLGPAGR